MFVALTTNVHYGIVAVNAACVVCFVRPVALECVLVLFLDIISTHSDRNSNALPFSTYKPDTSAICL